MRGGAGRAFLLKEGVGIMEVLLEGLGLVLQTSLWGGRAPGTDSTPAKAVR